MTYTNSSSSVYLRCRSVVFLDVLLSTPASAPRCRLGLRLESKSVSFIRPFHKARGLQDKNAEKNQESHNILEDGGDIAGGKTFQESENKAAYHCSGIAPNTTQHRARETLESHHGPLVIDHERDRSDQHASQGAQSTTEKVRNHHKRLHVDTHQARGALILCTGAHCLSNECTFEKEPEDKGDNNKGSDHPEHLRGKTSPEKGDALNSCKCRCRVRVLPPDQKRHTF